MHLLSRHGLLAASLVFASVAFGNPSVSKGKVLDYAVEACLDRDGNVRCTRPFLVEAGACYRLRWTTDGVISHTTVEVRDAGSGDIVFYRDTDGDWTPEKGELVYLDFKPKIWKAGNQTVEYEVDKCSDDEL